ncbi:MAG: LuxR family transcriptional regulator [Alphaproteobacteria bacterium]
MLEHIDRFIAAMAEAKNLDDIFAALRRQLERFNIERFAYELIWSDQGARPTFYITSYPSDWSQHYIEKKYSSHDMVIRHSAREVRPFMWQEVNRDKNLTPTQRLVFNEARDVGLRSGCSVPIHGPGAVKAYLSVASAVPDEEFAKIFVRYRHEIHLLATYAHEQIIAFGLHDMPPLAVKLTPREIEVLNWTAGGKTRWEIAEILGISEETVKNHITHACTKLGTNSKTHAVAIALIQGLIAL